MDQQRLRPTAIGQGGLVAEIGVEGAEDAAPAIVAVIGDQVVVLDLVPPVPGFALGQAGFDDLGRGGMMIADVPIVSGIVVGAAHDAEEGENEHGDRTHWVSPVVGVL